MIKVALINDTHWGIRSDAEFFLDNIKTFLDQSFFPYLDKHKIKKVVHLGDIVDRRKYISFLTARRLRKDFLEPLKKRGVSMDLIAGNHDLYYKQKTHVNAFDELIHGYPNIKFYLTATETKLGTLPVLYVPWICDANREESLKLIKKTKALDVFGHLELSGFEMHKGVYRDHGQDPGMFSKFDNVFSGHYHHKSTFRSVHYLGAPCEFSWSDYNDPRGFHVFDTSTKKLEFIQNTYTAFEKIFYDDSSKSKKEILKENFARLKDKYVKVIVKSKTNIPLFDQYTNKVEEAGAVNVQIVDDHLNQDLVSENGDIEVQDTLTIFKNYIKEANNIISADKLDSMITELYQEALSQE